MTFADIRRGTDVEFGLSVYEPFGISQLEPLSCGALCVVSNVCGCAGFARQVSGGQEIDNIIVADYLKVAEALTVEQLLDLPTSERDRIESQENQRLAELVLHRLPSDAETIRRRIEAGGALAGQMSWEHVVQDYFLPSLARAATPVRPEEGGGRFEDGRRRAYTCAQGLWPFGHGRDPSEPHGDAGTS